MGDDRGQAALRSLMDGTPQKDAGE